MDPGMDFQELLSRLALAFGIGLLIGLERGWRTRDVAPGKRAAGVRTFAISGLLGGIVAAVAQGAGGALSIGGSILLGTAFMAFAGVITTFTRDQNKSTGTVSATTTIAALLTFMLGAYALLGDVRIAAAAAVATTGILVVREELHGWVAKLSLAELESGLILLAMTFIALPIVPDRSVGPFGGVNPRAVWIIAIVLASVSFAGYVAVKLLGERRGVRTERPSHLIPDRHAASWQGKHDHVRAIGKGNEFLGQQPPRLAPIAKDSLTRHVPICSMGGPRWP